MSDLDLLRAYEPVLVHTRGEMFFACSIDDYLARSSMWVTERGVATRLAAPGEVHRDNLGELSRSVGPDAATHLRFVEHPLDWSDYLRWRSSPDRPHFSAVGRWSRVGLFSRLVDAGFDVALSLRGVVPGGTTAVAQQQYATFEPDAAIPTPTYYGRVVREGGWVALQYWFFYAMNDFRSTYFGVNDHEADWEQVIVYLPESVVDAAGGVPEVAPSWVAYASHDLSGDDLRRRADDPTLEFVDGRHPVVYVGAGSHAAYFEAGEYPFAVSPRMLIRVSDGISQLRRVWREGFGQGSFDPLAERDTEPWAIPFVDYARGDGERIGPGQEHQWNPVLIDGEEGWVADFRGLWGLDTRDPLGGERAPAGPKFERDASVRRSWGDVLGFVGMDKVVPEPDLPAVIDDRLARLHAEREEITERVDDARGRLRDEELDRLAVEVTADSRTAQQPMAEHERDAQEQLQALVDRRVELDETLRATNDLRDRLRDGRPTDPRQHIVHSHRPRATSTDISRFAETWAALSAGLMLIAVLGVALSDLPNRFVIIALAVVAFLGIDAALRGRGVRFLLNYTIGMALVAALILMISHWQLAILIPVVLIVYSTARGNLRELRVLRMGRKRRAPDSSA